MKGRRPLTFLYLCGCFDDRLVALEPVSGPGPINFKGCASARPQFPWHESAICFELEGTSTRVGKLSDSAASRSYDELNVGEWTKTHLAVLGAVAFVPLIAFRTFIADGRCLKIDQRASLSSHHWDPTSPQPSLEQSPHKPFSHCPSPSTSDATPKPLGSSPGSPAAKPLRKHLRPIGSMSRT